MYKLAYSDAIFDSPAEARARECEAIEHSIDLMEKAQEAGVRSPDAMIALNFLRELWTIFIEDLAKPQNELPPVLRAQLISIGVSLLRQAEDIRMERQADFSSLIDISRLIVGGLR
jgi:flagellar biosynthesis activator protein FlaF